MRSKILLIVAIVSILAINSLIPVLKASAHYTEAAEEITYGEYKELDPRYELTFFSRALIKEYKETVIRLNPDLTAEEMFLIEPPEDMKVSVYTKFFFENYMWYVENILNVVSAVVLFYSIFQYYLLKKKETTEEYLEIKKRVDLANESAVDPKELEEYLEEDFNMPRKLKQHISNVKNKLIALENKTSIEIKNKFKEHFEFYEKLENPIKGYNKLPSVIYNLNRKERRYKEKKEELLNKISKSYLEKYLKDIKVKGYNEITAGFVYTGDLKVNKVGDEYSNILSDAKRIRRDSYLKILYSIGIVLSFATIITLLAVDIENMSTIDLVIRAISKLTPLSLQIKLGIDYSDTFLNDQLIKNLVFREKIITMFLKGKVDVN